MIIYTIKYFIKNNVHIGHYKWECDYRLSYLLLGMRNSIHIINIYNSLYILKRILYIIYNLGLINQRILIVNNINYKLTSFLNNLNKNKIWYINKKWIGGLLTNQKQLYIYNEKIYKQFYEVGYKSILPSFVFTSNIENSGSCIFEAIILNISNSSLIDTNIGYFGIFYKLSSNDDNYIVMTLFSKIMAKIYIKSIFDRKKNLIKREEKNKKQSKQKKEKKNRKKNIIKKIKVKTFKEYLNQKRNKNKKKYLMKLGKNNYNKNKKNWKKKNWKNKNDNYNKKNKNDNYNKKNKKNWKKNNINLNFNYLKKEKKNKKTNWNEMIKKNKNKMNWDKNAVRKKAWEKNNFKN